MAKNYWMIILSADNFEVTREHGFKFQGFKVQHPRKVQRVGPGDRLLFYLHHTRKFAATTTVTSPCIQERGLPWVKEGNAEWAYKVDIQPDYVLDREDYMDAHQIGPRMEYVRRWIPEDWYMAFQENLHLLPKKDFQLIEDEMRKLQRQTRRRHGPAATDSPAASATAPN